MNIKRAASAEDFERARALFREYVKTPGVAVCAVGFEDELRGLKTFYDLILLAFDGGMAVGCGALRTLEPRVGELKRIYVRPEARGLGVGRELTKALVEQARAMRVVRLDTLPSMAAAIRVYESLGFRRVGQYASSHPGGAICYELTVG